VGLLIDSARQGIDRVGAVILEHRIAETELGRAVSQ
jgi:hypothetical protein